MRQVRKTDEAAINQRQKRSGPKSESKSSEGFEAKWHRFPKIGPGINAVSAAEDRNREYRASEKNMGERTKAVRAGQTPSTSKVIAGKGKGKVTERGPLAKAKADAAAGRKVAAKARLRLARLTGQDLRPERPQDRIKKR